MAHAGHGDDPSAGHAGVLFGRRHRVLSSLILLAEDDAQRNAGAPAALVERLRFDEVVLG
jgi:hypothetical protein